MIKRLTVFLLLLTTAVGMAMAESRQVILFKTPLEPIDDDPIETRIPSRPIPCSISEDGIFIPGYEVNDIVVYEAYDINGVCLMTTDDARDYSTFILSIETEDQIEIRLTTQDYILKGYSYR